MAASAAAEPPTKLIIHDPFEPNKAYEILRVVLKAQPADGDWAVVRLRDNREVQVGDAIDFWFNLDGDKEPDIHVVGLGAPTSARVVRDAAPSRWGASKADPPSADA